MARKPLLDATSRPDTSFSEFTKGYRQSQNIEDRRGPEFDNDRDQAAMDLFLDSVPGGKRIDRMDQTRKVDAEEAVRKTHFERN